MLHGLPLEMAVPVRFLHPWDDAALLVATQEPVSVVDGVNLSRLFGVVVELRVLAVAVWASVPVVRLIPPTAVSADAVFVTTLVVKFPPESDVAPDSWVYARTDSVWMSVPLASASGRISVANVSVMPGMGVVPLTGSNLIAAPPAEAPTWKLGLHGAPKGLVEPEKHSVPDE
jgi:hypothetical protein